MESGGLPRKGRGFSPASGRTTAYLVALGPKVEDNMTELDIPGKLRVKIDRTDLVGKLRVLMVQIKNSNS